MSSQPIHPSFASKLDPEYTHFHNAHLQQIVSPHTIPWNPVTRNAVGMPGASPALPVGSTKDYSLSECNVRVFTPPGSAPQGGWPVFIFFHGGKGFSTDMHCNYRELTIWDRWLVLR